jgi:hypothetical protein
VDVADLVHAVKVGIKALAASLALCGLAAGTTSVHSCGFEDPNGVESVRGLLNWAYPNALYVRTAVWQAENDGILPSRETAKANDFAAYLSTITALKALSSRIGKTAHALAKVPPLSIVLIDKVLWSRFESGPAGHVAKIHATGPETGDIVIVTEGSVIQALVEGRLTPKLARQMGLLRYYGATDEVSEVQELLQQMNFANPSDGTQAAAKD